jgi:hypothetical protein
MVNTRKTLICRSLLRIGALLTALFLMLSACVPAMQDTAEEPLKKSEIKESGAIESPADTPTPTRQVLLSTVRATELIPVTPSDPVTPGSQVTPTEPVTPGSQVIPGEQVTPGDLSPPVTGEVPASLLEDIRADLAQRSGVTQEAILVIRDQAVTWSDGSLGCPQPGVFYTQALVPGYWVVLQVGENQYDYRASESGYFFVCEGSGLPFTRP